MKNLKKSKTIKFCILLIWLSIVLAIINIFPVFSTELETNNIIDDAFKLTQSETLRYGLGSFGATSFNPLNVIDGWIQVLGL